MEQPVARARHGDGRGPLALSSYVTALAARRLVGRYEPLREPEGEQLVTAALFADISGFTALTERLAQIGPGGVEELMELLNAALAHSELGRHLAGTPQERWHLEQTQTLLHELGIADVAGWGRCAG